MLPILAWVPVMTSAVLLVALWSVGELSGRAAAMLGAWFLAAAYLQFNAASLVATTVGLVSQAVLAIYLVVRTRLPSMRV